MATFTALLLVITTPMAADRFVPATGSMVRIEGTSSLQAWTMEGNTINGHLSVDSVIARALTDDAWKSAGEKPVSVRVMIPIATIKSEHDAMDKLMATALKARTNPEIRYEMTSATLQQATGPTFALKTVGKLTIAGVTKPVAMTVAGTRTSDGRYVLAGQTPIRMSDFGITPPKVMMGTITTGDDVKVTFRWVVAARD